MLSPYFKNNALLFVIVACAVVSPVVAQNQQEAKDKPAAPTSEVKPEDVAEGVIFIYGGGLGRQNLDQIRKTTFERGKITTFAANGKSDNYTYERFVIRGASLDKDKVRMDQTIAGAKYGLVYNGEKLSLVFNDSVFAPREDVANAFMSRMFNGVEALLRYKENESKLEFVRKDRQMGVDFYVVDVIDKKERRTRFYVSIRQLRIMMLEYEQDGVKFRRRFYNHDVAQGTLVPFRSVLWEGDRIVEETEILTVTYGQKVEETLFQ